MLSAALKYLSKGASVIPVGADKKPAILWKEYQTRLPTEEEVKKWWTDYPNANVGIVTGKISNVIVVDVEKGGDISRFPETDTIQTGGGGWHLYYNYTPYENKARIFPLTDIRGDGGYVVAPPSIHKSGETYKMLVLRGRKPFPREMFEGVVKQGGKWNFELLKGVSSGSRNESAAKVIGKVLNMFPKSEWNEAWNFVKAWNDKNIPPLPDWEIRAVFNSIAKKEGGKEKEVIELVENNQPNITMTDVINSASIEILNTNASTDVVSFGYDWLDDRMTGIFRGELIVIGGESGTGKTTFATNIIYKNSQKHKCFIFALEDRLVYYGTKAIYFEVNKIKFAKDRKKYSWNSFIRNEITDPEYLTIHKQAVKNLENGNIEFYRNDSLMDIETLEVVLEKKVAEGVDLFLIDHLHYFDLLKGDSSKADYIEKVMSKIKTIQNRTGARILMVVHYKKLGGSKPSLDSFKDSISIVQNANYVINLWRDRSELSEYDGENVSTFFYIPKARNPNGETSIEVMFNKHTNDYTLKKINSGTPQENAEVKEVQLKIK